MSVLVSVVCTAYNHEKYIRDALEGFVNQVTDFQYEVIVNDDASTDGTAAIISEYAEKYPDLIRPILQKENRYSKGHHVMQETIGLAVGKYLALCEGDDYWIDPYKLQKQVDYMRTHPECTFCFTNGLLYYGDQLDETNRVVPINRYAVMKKDSCDYSVAELDLLEYIPTASFLYIRELPPFTMPKGAFLGDAYRKLWATSYGYAHFIDEPCVVYRRAVPGSATAVMASNVKSLERHCNAMLLLYQGLLEHIPEKMQDVCAMRTCQWEISKAALLQDNAKLKQIRKSGMLKTLKCANLYARILYSLQCCFPQLHKNVRSLAKKLLKSLNK